MYFRTRLSTTTNSWIVTRLLRPCFAAAVPSPYIMETITLWKFRPVAGPGTDHGPLSLPKTESKLKRTIGVQRPRNTALDLPDCKTSHTCGSVGGLLQPSFISSLGYGLSCAASQYARSVS